MIKKFLTNINLLFVLFLQSFAIVSYFYNRDLAIFGIITILSIITAISSILRTNADEKAILDIELQDERNRMIRYQSQAKANTSLSFILSVLILFFIIMQKDFTLLVVIFLFAINSILMNYYYSKLQKKY
ncbi:MAG: hypothetical protein N4A40_08985 [Tissierellales bacterium]|nr:hypothetical protein [Tissierellales bacterium]